MSLGTLLSWRLRRCSQTSSIYSVYLERRGGDRGGSGVARRSLIEDDDLLGTKKSR